MDIKFPVNKMPWSEELKAAWRYVVEFTCSKSIYYVDLLTTEIGLLTMPDDTARRIWTAAGLVPDVDEAVAHLSKILDKYADNYRKKFPGPKIVYSDNLDNVVRHAEKQATLMGRPALEVGTFLYGVERFKDFDLCQWPVKDYPDDKVYNYLLVLYGLEKKLASRSIPKPNPTVAVKVPPAVSVPGLVRPASKVQIPENLAAFVSDMTASALRYDPVFGREKEIQEVIEVLARRMKNSAILVGPPGVGKTASCATSACSSSTLARCSPGLHCAGSLRLACSTSCATSRTSGAPRSCSLTRSTCWSRLTTRRMGQVRATC